ncbi:hypothetical protein ACLOJK_018848 [Asimina triloba]
MDHHKGHTKRFLLRPHLAVHFFQMYLHHFHSIHASSKHLTSRSMASIMSTRSSQSRNCRDCTQRTAKIVCPCAPMTLAQATSFECCWTEHTTASLAHCLARLPPRRTPPSCLLPAIPHVGKVGVGVSRPQRTTAMPTSHAAAATVTAQLQCPIRVAYK